MISILQATSAHSQCIAPLFDAYRQFYGKPGDLELAARFLRQRLEQGESVVFFAETGAGDVVGFVQLYPSFSSVSAARIYVLNDLFVAPVARRSSVARMLMAAALGYARTQGAVRLSLSTGKNNSAAQGLYESEGWVRDELYYHYSQAI